MTAHDRHAPTSPAASATSSRAGAGIDRRSFLALGGAATAAGLVGVGSLASPAGAAAIPRAERALSVGFLEGSETWNLRQLPWEQPALPAGWTGKVLPARSLPLGDQSLAGEVVTVRVFGLYPTPTLLGAEQVAGASLLLRFTADDEVTTVDQIAWGVRRTPFSAGNRVSQMIRLGVHGELTLAVEVTTIAEARRAGAAQRLLRTQVEPERNVYRTTFTVDWGEAPKLQRGLYFLGLAAGTFEREVAIPAKPRAQRTDLRSILVAIDTVLGAPAR
jgi:hypothetical protein